MKKFKVESENDFLRKENQRLKYWLGKIIRFWECGNSVGAHQFSLREAKKLLIK